MQWASHHHFQLVSSSFLCIHEVAAGKCQCGSLDALRLICTRLRKCVTDGHREQILNHQINNSASLAHLNKARGFPLYRPPGKLQEIIARVLDKAVTTLDLLKPVIS